MKVTYERFDNSNQNNYIRAHQLYEHDVISYYPQQPHKKKYKIGQYVSIGEVAEAMFNSPALRLDKDRNINTMFRVNGMKYIKFPWWQFWKRRKYVSVYYLEVIQRGW